MVEDTDTDTNTAELTAHELEGEMIIGHGTDSTCPLAGFDAVRDAVPDMGVYTEGDLVATVTYEVNTETVLDITVNDPLQGGELNG